MKCPHLGCNSNEFYVEGCEIYCKECFYHLDAKERTEFWEDMTPSNMLLNIIEQKKARKEQRQIDKESNCLHNTHKRLYKKQKDKEKSVNMSEVAK